MKAILVDDEKLHLQRLKTLLENKMTGIEVIGTYINPLEALEMIQQLKPDILFLDIEMPYLNGLQLGERIQEVSPDIEIVFVTAFDKYAVQAFELYAIDYIRKPILLKRLKMTIERLKARQINRPTPYDNPPSPTKSISCFHTIGVQVQNDSTEVIKWRTGKAQELFAYMLHHRGQVIYRDTLLELLWPDFDFSRGSKQLYTTIYHIRKTLKDYGLEEITISRIQLDHGYQLDINNMQIDTARWSDQVLTPEPLTHETVGNHEQLLQAYEGEYFGKHDYLWAEGERERLRQLFLNHARRLHTFYVEHHQVQAAIRVNEQIQQYVPIEEDSYFNLMKLYASLDNELAVHDQYHKLYIMITEQFDTLLPVEITSWYEQWLLSIK